MKELAKLYFLFNLLSLDVAAGAIVSAWFFSRIFRVHILSWGLLSLGLTVWIIYTIDHLMDAKRASVPAASTRHRFYQQHFQEIALALLAAVLTDGVLITFIREPVFRSGSLLGVAVAIYLLVQRHLKYVKELSGALLYSLGVLLPALSLSQISIGFSQGMLIVQFSMTVLCNLILFSLFDLRQDIQDNHHSFVTAVGEKGSRFILSALFLMNGALLVIQLFYGINGVGTLLALTVMNLVLFLIFTFRKRFEAYELYRLFGDAVFLVPLIFFWL